uniref:Uncharacterized protein n=1 Tax=Candidozyma auris TaxID=498019 RepID=A0A0L0P0L4_CANAR
MTQPRALDFALDEQALEAFKQYLYELERSIQQQIDRVMTVTRGAPRGGAN